MLIYKGSGAAISSTILTLDFSGYNYVLVSRDQDIHLDNPSYGASNNNGWCIIEVFNRELAYNYNYNTNIETISYLGNNQYTITSVYQSMTYYVYGI